MPALGAHGPGLRVGGGDFAHTFLAHLRQGLLYFLLALAQARDLFL
jgi:hypothetical protein